MPGGTRHAEELMKRMTASIPLLLITTTSAARTMLCYNQHGDSGPMVNPLIG